MSQIGLAQYANGQHIGLVGHGSILEGQEAKLTVGEPCFPCSCHHMDAVLRMHMGKCSAFNPKLGFLVSNVRNMPELRWADGGV